MDEVLIRQRCFRKYLWELLNLFGAIYGHSRLKGAIQQVMQAPIGMRSADGAIYGLPYPGTKWGR